MNFAKTQTSPANFLFMYSALNSNCFCTNCRSESELISSAGNGPKPEISSSTGSIFSSILKSEGNDGPGARFCWTKCGGKLGPYDSLCSPPPLDGPAGRIGPMGLNCLVTLGDDGAAIVFGRISLLSGTIGTWYPSSLDLCLCLECLCFLCFLCSFPIVGVIRPSYYKTTVSVPVFEQTMLERTTIRWTNEEPGQSETILDSRRTLRVR